MREEEIFTYDGRTGQVTRSTVPAITEEKQLFMVTKLEAAIVKQVMRRVQQEG